MSTEELKSWRVTTTAELPIMPESFIDQPYNFYFPINLRQVEQLLGKILTHIEALGLSPGVEKANKDLLRQSIWQWFSDVQENSLTSYRGIIAPIVRESDDITDPSGDPPVDE